MILRSTQASPAATAPATGAPAAAQDKAAVKIQKTYRGYLARRRFALYQLPEAKQADCHAFLIGNDPMIENLEQHKTENGQIALVATSGMRVLLLASELANRTNSRSIPKIFLVDNSHQVAKVWEIIKKLMQANHHPVDFLRALEGFISAEKNKLYMDFTDDDFTPPCVNEGIKYPKQDVIEYFKGLFQQYGFEYIRAMVLFTTLVSQSWEDVATFTKIKNILDTLNIRNIYIYASNIIHCVPENLRMPILQNISRLQARLSIHTDLSKAVLTPEKVYLLRNQEQAPAEAYRALNIPR